MRQKKVKQLRKYIRKQGLSISAEPYSILPNRMVIASKGRQQYQQAKEAIR